MLEAVVVVVAAAVVVVVVVVVAVVDFDQTYEQIYKPLFQNMNTFTSLHI